MKATALYRVMFFLTGKDDMNKTALRRLKANGIKSGLRRTVVNTLEELTEAFALKEPRVIVDFNYPPDGKECLIAFELAKVHNYRIEETSRDV